MVNRVPRNERIKRAERRWMYRASYHKRNFSADRILSTESGTGEPVIVLVHTIAAAMDVDSCSSSNFCPMDYSLLSHTSSLHL